MKRALLFVLLAGCRGVVETASGGAGGASGTGGAATTTLCPCDCPVGPQPGEHVSGFCNDPAYQGHTCCRGPGVHGHCDNLVCVP